MKICFIDYEDKSIVEAFSISEKGRVPRYGEAIKLKEIKWQIASVTYIPRGDRADFVCDIEVVIDALEPRK